MDFSDCRTIEIGADEDFTAALKAFLDNGYAYYQGTTDTLQGLLKELYGDSINEKYEVVLVKIGIEDVGQRIFLRRKSSDYRFWIYAYLRADREEIDMGPYSTLYEAVKAMEKHCEFGALVTGPFEKPSGYKLYKGE